MPTFSGQVRHQNSGLPIVDLSDGTEQFNASGRSPIRGMGLFSSEGSRTNVDSGLRTRGYMAIVNSTPYVYNSASLLDDDWGSTSNWTTLSATAGIPTGGLTDELLAKKTASDYDADWVNTIVIEDAQLKKHDDTPGTPTLTFSRKKTSATLSDGDSLGELSSVGFNSSGEQRTGSSIKFVADGSVGSGIGSRVEFWTSTSATSDTPEKALTIDTDKKIIFAGNSSAPSVVEGGMYYNTNNNAFYVGIGT